MQEETCIERFVSVEMRGGVPGKVEGLGASEGDSLVVQHGSVWSMWILDMFPPIRVRVYACACRDLRGQSGLFVGLRAPYYARRGPLERAGRFDSIRHSRH